MPRRTPLRLRALGAVSASLAAVGVLVAVPQQASAFKPYTHAVTGQSALSDVTDDGKVTIDGRDYPVDGRIVAALAAYPSHYLSGVIGPDGFPDLVMGQSIIHPENTGLWLRHIMAAARAAQDDPSRGVEEKKQILAFAYGYLTHASGDLWMHTMINEFAHGVFPGVGEILTDVDMASIALRHLVAEGYVGDATAGFDGNPAREHIDTNDDGVPDDWSDDSTPAIQYDAPLDFIHDTLVVRQDGAGNPVGPAQDRGAILDAFYDLRADLAAEIDNDPDPIGAALAHYNDLDAKFDALVKPPPSADSGASGDCTFGYGNDTVTAAIDVGYDLVACPIALAAIGIGIAIDSFAAMTTLVTETMALALDALVDAYLEAWVDDIDAGIAAWPQVGLGLTRALFDPQARRDTQNEECDHLGADSGDPLSTRSTCEDAKGAVSVVLHELDPFINDHLLSMAGMPDFLGDFRGTLQEFSAALDDAIGPALNPVRDGINALENEVMQLVKDEISKRYGLDVDQVQGFLDSPSSKMDVAGLDMDLPLVGHVNVPIWRTTTDDTHPETDHAKLDRYLGITGDHHGGSGGGLGDDVTFDPEVFAAYRNTVVLNKMLLLGGEQTDALLGDITGGDYSFYADQPLANVMLTPLPGSAEPGQWLRSIDGDHAWRTDGKPMFPDEVSGGTGAFPLWESCVLRPAFRELFNDWENDGDRDGLEPGTVDADFDGWLDPGENFPDLGDATSADPNDPTPPVSAVTITGTQAPGVGRTYVTDTTGIEVAVSDGYWPDEHIGLKVDLLAEDGTELDSALVSDGYDVSLAGRPDGTYRIRTQAKDACGVETAHETVVTLDTTAPVITITSPVAGKYDTDDMPVIAYSTDDGPANVGSGVASEAVTFDGAAATNGQVLDMFFLAPDEHTVVVTAADRLGNGGSESVTFDLEATAQSLVANVERARSLGLITDAAVYRGLRDTTSAALRAHNRGQHATEHLQLGAFVSQLAAQSGKGIDATTAARFTAFARDLIANGG